MEKTRILFISRAYPPIVGGIENQNYELSVWLNKLTPTTTIANTRGRKFLPLFAPYALLRALFSLKKYDVILLGDGTLAILGWIIKLFTKKPVASVVHGLDINYNSKSLNVWYEKFLVFIYQSFWIKVFIKKLDKLIAVGNETIAVGTRQGIPRDKFVFIPNGIDPSKFNFTHPKSKLAEILPDVPLENNFFLLTSGRLAKRKGVAWFIANVLPQLPTNVHYVVAGAGPGKENIAQAVAQNNLTARVHLLGYVSDETRNILFATCDLFIQPNIQVPGDMEGFGISVIEAAACQIPVLAARLEGLQDAIKDGDNGFLLESANPAVWLTKINTLLAEPSTRQQFGRTAAQFVKENYAWEKIAARYADILKK